MEQHAIDILDRHRLMTIATLRADGWPQATTVSYANDGLILYFIVSRSSQKYANIARDDRVGIAVARDFDDPGKIEGLSISALGSEVKDPQQREKAYKLLIERHPAFASFGAPDFKHAALMRAACRMISIIDYGKGFGHTELLTVAGTVVGMQAARPDNWGFAPAPAMADDGA